MGKFIDLTGQVFGRLQVVKRIGTDKYGHTVWLCACICGKEVVISGTNLKRGNTKSCGCLQKELAKERRFIDLTGKVFGRLKVIKYVYTRDRKPYWLCLCSCGKEVVVSGNRLCMGATKSCGCLLREIVGNRYRGVPLSKDQKKKFIGSRVGKPLSIEHRIKIGIGNKDKIVSEETKRKMSEACKGERNHSWKGGITPLCGKIRDLEEYNVWRRKVFVRDSYTCQECNKSNSGGIVAHHKIPFAYILGYYKIDTINKALECNQLWDPENGITLCEPCHKQHHKELK